MSADRILRWVTTGMLTFEETDIVHTKTATLSDYVSEHEKPTSAQPSDDDEQTSADNHTHVEETFEDEHIHVTTDSSSKDERRHAEWLVCMDNDIVKPTTDQINSTFVRSERLWRSYLAHAESIPVGCMPKGSLDPYILLQNMPPLPQVLPREESIEGQSLWYIPHPELPKACRDDEKRPLNEDAWNPELVYNSRKKFYLGIENPTECRIYSTPRHGDEVQDSIAILTLCWAYILTRKFLEMQRRHIQYSSTRLTPVLSHGFRPQAGDIVLYLGSASKHLVRWLSALLAPGLGWSVDGSLPPWAAHYCEATRFVITTDVPFHFLETERPPSSRKATRLLLEYCRLNSVASQGKLSQPTEAFLAALALPFYSRLNLQPQLPMPKAPTSSATNTTSLDYIQSYVDDLPYFMTLSISPECVGSVIWSLFWEPGIDCNLVSAWFSSILKVIRRFIETGNTDTLSKVFAFRQERVGLLWHAILRLGDLKWLDMIVAYLETHEERWGGSYTRPDIGVAIWTGSPQSFLDEDISDSYEEMTSKVSRSDLVRHRFNFLLGIDIGFHFGWQPFGHVMKEQIEPELWPGLELGRSREYKLWIWWEEGEDGQIIAQIQQGFKHDKAIYPKDNELHSGDHDVPIPEGFTCKVKFRPSFEATWAAVHSSALDASGDWNLEASLIEGIRAHPWFEGSRA